MLRAGKITTIVATALVALGLTACSSSSDSDDASDKGWKPVTVKHALGTTKITSKPKRVATVNWANQEVPLALGIVPVGMAKATFGDDDKDGVLPWVEDKLKDLDAKTPTLFDESDGIDFEAVADTKPDVILAAYSGLTKADYKKLSEIAPVVAYPETAWGTPWRDMITVSSKALGKQAAGERLISRLEGQIDKAVAKHPQIKGKKTMFVTHVDPSDLSQVSYYTTHDTRVMFFDDLGMKTPKAVADASAKTKKFSMTTSAERADTFGDVDVIVTYGGDKIVKSLEKDPLLSKVPAVANGAIVNLPADNPLGTAANPTPLSLSWVLDDYLDLIAKAASKN